LPRIPLGGLKALLHPQIELHWGRRREGEGMRRKGRTGKGRRGGRGGEGRRREGKGGGEGMGPDFLGQVYAPGRKRRS